MQINIDEKALGELFKNTDASDFFWIYPKTDQLFNYIKNDYCFYLFNDPQDGSLIFHCHNTELEPMDNGLFTQHSTMVKPFSELADDYVEYADGSYSIEHMRNHIKQLREFADRIESQCVDLENE